MKSEIAVLLYKRKPSFRIHFELKALSLVWNESAKELKMLFRGFLQSLLYSVSCRVERSQSLKASVERLTRNVRFEVKGSGQSSYGHENVNWRQLNNATLMAGVKDFRRPLLCEGFIMDG